MQLSAEDFDLLLSAIYTFLYVIQCLLKPNKECESTFAGQSLLEYRHVTGLDRGTRQ